MTNVYIKGYYGSREKRVNVSEKVNSFFVRSGILKINNFFFNDLFGDPLYGIRKKLYIEFWCNDEKLQELVFNEMTNNVHILKNKTIEIPLNNIKIYNNNDIDINIPDIQIVYFLWINPKTNWKHLLTNQLDDLKSNGLLNVIKGLNIHISSQSAENTQSAIEIINNYYPAVVSISNINEWEYRGIHKVWELVQKEPNNSETIFLYFHSKGMTEMKNNRNKHEKILFEKVIDNWKKNIYLFEKVSTINKIGYGASESGFIWFNFWWARASYLKNCVEPVKTNDRFYYERWLALNTNGSNIIECFSTLHNTTGITYSPYEILNIISDAIIYGNCLLSK